MAVFEGESILFGFEVGGERFGDCDGSVPAAGASDGGGQPEAAFPFELPEDKAHEILELHEELPAWFVVEYKSGDRSV
jgi:hypothetical protein